MKQMDFHLGPNGLSLLTKLIMMTFTSGLSVDACLQLVEGNCLRLCEDHKQFTDFIESV